MEISPRWERTEAPPDRRLRDALSDWFVRYNPLYFFSALCVLGGVFLLSNELDAAPWRTGRLRLLGALEAYSWLLVGSAAFLDRVARQRRPAVLLGLVASVFLFDCTLQSEALGTLGGVGLRTAVAWLALRLVEVEALLALFRLRASASARARLASALALVALGPHIASAGPSGISWLVWGGGLIAASLPGIVARVRSSEALDDWGQVVLARVLRTVGWGGAGLCVAHLLACVIAFRLHLGFPHVAPIVLFVALATEEELLAWGGATLAILISAGAPDTLLPAAVATGVALSSCAARRGQPRLHVAALLAFALAIIAAGAHGGDPPAPSPSLCIALAVALAVVAWRHRLRLAEIASAASLLLGVWRLGGAPFPRTRAEWGAALLGTGFVSLLAGVVVSWRARCGVDPPHPVP